MITSILALLLILNPDLEKTKLEQNLAALSSASDSLKSQLYIGIAVAYENSDHDLFKLYLDSAVQLAEKIQNNTCLADAYHTKALYYSNVGNFEDAIDFYQKSIKLKKELNDHFGVFRSNCNLGIIYVRTGKYNQATRYFFEALDYAEKENNQNAIADCLGYIGHLNYYQKNFDQALKYHKKSKASLLKVKDFEGARTADINIGIAYYQLDNPDSAMYHYQASLDSNIVANDVYSQSHCHNNIGQIYKDAGNYKKAIEHLTKGLDIRIQFKDTTGIAHGYHYIASIYLASGKFKEGVDMLKKAAELSQKMQFTELLKSSYLELSEAYENSGAYKKSLDFHKKVLAISDTILSKDKINALESAQTKYETEKKEQEIELLTAKTQVQELEIQNNQYMLGGIVGIAILLVISTVALYSRKNYKLKANLAQEKEAQQKLRFKSVIEGEEKERKRIAQDLHDGLGQLLSTARLNVSVLEDELDKDNSDTLNNSLKLIDSAVNEVRTISHNMMPNALISIGFEAALKEQVHLINDAGKVYVDLSLPNEKINLNETQAISLYRIIQEIMNNALKYAEADNIRIDIFQSQQNQLTVEINDDGIGFDTKVIGSSSGIGWENIISRTDLLNGQLDIQSVLGKGSDILLKIAV